MARQRCIPFGYRMDRAAIVSEDAEAEAVRQIFSLYLAGNSMSQIAEEMTHRALRYHRDTARWNKNMVKRILENRHYLGDDRFPQIVGEEEYQRVQQRKAEKNTYAPCPPEIAAVKDRLVCANCGAPLERWSLGKGRTSWKCADPQCRSIVHLRDAELIGKLERCLTALGRRAQTNEDNRPASQAASLEVLRLENELTSAFNRTEESADYVRALIFAIAAEKYKLLPEEPGSHKASIIWERLEHQEINSQMMREIADVLIESITIEKNGTLKIKLNNGNSVTEEELEKWN